MKPPVALLIVLISATNLSWAQQSPEHPSWQAIDISLFSDAIQHALMKFKDRQAPYERYELHEIDKIADNMVVLQNPDGGWPKNIDWLKKRAEADSTRGKYRKSTLDNRNIYSQITYLSEAYRQTGWERYKQSALRGVKYILGNQHTSGGWRGSDVDAITFNDDVMTGVLQLLKDVTENRNLYGYVSDSTLAQVQDAYDRGIECILACQIKIDGKLTAWCQQHSHNDYSPIWARSFEPPSICSAESVPVVQLLMDIENPSDRIVQAVMSAVQWFDDAKIEGLRVETITAEPIMFPYHFSETDKVEVRDEQAPPIWARMYSLEDSEPIFCTRERKITRDFTEVSRERRTGYAWHGYWPAKLLEEYPAWLETINP
jgi:PelA/Pel-15E family pectate lyase